MWACYTCGYLAIGLVFAGFVLAAAPEPGFRPALRWVLAAVFCFTLLWPFLAMLGLGYLLGRWYNQPAVDRRESIRPKPARRFTYGKLFDETPN